MYGQETNHQQDQIRGDESIPDSQKEQDKEESEEDEDEEEES